ncbi:hypothetical protein [Actinomadura rugatobispora]|uniref:Uncharacterized protein n=1 Tax=Actinomadura rugatobispora TaxID=1994 RepID=A0ABW1AGG1_9ACTN|nr:hypothetical protein GCM10010200_072360 [Actinomadura rugatobispora]
MSDQEIAATIAGRAVRIVQPYGTVPTLFNVRDADGGERLAILLDLGDDRWKVVRTDLGEPFNLTEVDAESVEEAAQAALLP